MAKSFKSIIGPTTMKASREVRENWLNEAATKASASEQIESRTASTARVTTPTAALSARA